MSQNYPPLNYYTGADVYDFPDDSTELESYLIENSISHILIEYWEPTYPDYIWKDRENREPSGILDDFTLEKTFEEYGAITIWVYST